MIKLSKIPEAIISCFSFIGIEKSILKRVGAKTADEFGRKMAANIDGMFAEHSNHLLAGRLLDAAIERWPVKQWPELYTPVRKNIEMPIVVDGRLITEEQTTWLSPLRLSRNSIEQAFNAVLKITVKRFYKYVLVALIVGLVGGLGTYFTTSKMSEISMEGPRVQYDFSPQYASSRPQSQPRMRKVTVAAFSSIAALLAAGGLFFGGAGIAYAFSIRRALSPKSIAGAVQTILESDKVLTSRTTESIVRYKHRIVERKNTFRAFRTQIRMSNRDKSPQWRVGIGTGTALFRGSLQGYQPGQEVSLSFRDLTLNVLILGLTGSGKSFGLLLPLLETVMREIRDTPVEQRTKIALLLLDGKVALVGDAKALAAKYGSKIRIIGCNPGEYGCDLFDGLLPDEIADTIASASRKGSPSSDAEFWEGGGKNIITHAATLDRAFEVTPEGILQMSRTGERIYSPNGIYETARACKYRGAGLLHEKVKAIIAAARSTDENVRNGILPFMTPALFESIKYLRIDAPDMAKDTLSSYLEHIRAMLSGFSTSTSMRKSFGTASSDLMLDINSVFDENTITCTTLSPAVGGESAYVAIKFIKERIYRQSKVRLQNDKLISLKSRLFVAIDEAQSIVTTGPYGEAEFLNQSRETGTSYIFASQSPPAFFAAFGETMGGSTTANLLDQFRQKIVASAEGLASHEFIQNLSGTALRSYIVEDGKYESYAAACIEKGRSINKIESFDYSDEEMFDLVKNGRIPERIEVQIKPLFEVDKRFIPESGRGGMSPEAAAQSVKEALSAMQQAVWRQEDKERASLTEGNSDQPIYNKNDLASLGQGQAICSFIVSGRAMTDIVEVDGPERGKAVPYDLSLMPQEVIDAMIASDKAVLNKKRKQSAEIVEAMDA